MAEGNRKLAAIMSADVVGYSRLMAADEACTVKSLKEYRATLTRVVDRHKGRVVNAPGDNSLSEFTCCARGPRTGLFRSPNNSTERAALRSAAEAEPYGLPRCQALGCLVFVLRLRGMATCMMTDPTAAPYTAFR